MGHGGSEAALETHLPLLHVLPAAHRFVALHSGEPGPPGLATHLPLLHILPPVHGFFELHWAVLVLPGFVGFCVFAGLIPLPPCCLCLNVL